VSSRHFKVRSSSLAGTYVMSIVTTDLRLERYLIRP
jgi:hypothetical protein